MDRKPLPIGVDIFEHLITRGYYYVDKTNLIRDLLDRKGSVNLFTRPRRFGKTLNISMLQYFFEDMRDKDGNRKDNSFLFEGLDIMRAGEKYLSHMGQYPVINLTLKGGKQMRFSSVLDRLAFEIQLEYRRHKYLFFTEKLSEQDRKRFSDFAYGKVAPEEYRDSLRFLSECLEQYYGKKVIILIDEYDVPLENAFMEGFYREMVDYIRAFFEVALKTNPSLDFAVITGCLRISKESIFTGMNNLNVISILDDRYDEYFGFTDAEVERMCGYYGLPQKYGVIKEWYDGYTFGKADVYNPWSVIKFVDDCWENPDVFPKSYWANTSSNSIVRELIDHADDEAKEEIGTLLGGGSIEKPVHEDVTYGEIYDSMDNLWNFMFFTGYFRKIGERMAADDTKYLTLCIPNREVQYIFRTKITAWFRDTVKQRDLSRLHSAFLSGDAGTVEEELGDVMLETIGSADEHENYYHGIVAGLMTGMKGYIVKSNRESGMGRCDLFVKPVSRRKEAFIVEFKVTRRLKDLEAKAEEALAQIADRKYDRELEDDNYSIISHYGIAFCGKECAVRFAGAAQ